MEKKEVYYYLKIIYRFLRSDRVKVVFKKMNNCAGLAIYGKATIELNPAGHILPTIIHESLHFIYPDWTETKVRIYSRKIFAKISKVQIINLHKYLFLALNRSNNYSNSNH